MTPQQIKAIELVIKYMPYTLSYRNDYSAKQCAIIAVDEILNISYFTHEPTEDDEMYKNFWQQVKEEINKL